MRRPWFVLLALIACLAGTAFLLVFPLSIVQPFKYQDPHALQRALLVFRIAPVTSIVLACLAIALCVVGWKRMRLFVRIAAVVLALLVAVTAGLTRINVYEQMFHPAGTPQFEPVAKAKWDADDMLVTVVLRGEAHGYPIRAMGYHHVVNDFVGGVPIVATY